MEAEYGSIDKIQFSYATAFDEKGNAILCKCGKPAGAGIIGKEASIHWCSDCSLLSKEPSAKLIYKPPYHET